MTEDLNERDERGLTLLHISAGRGDASAVQDLLQRGADPHLVDSRMGASPLHLAAQSGSVEVAKLLLAAGAFLNLQAPTHGIKVSAGDVGRVDKSPGAGSDVTRAS